MPECRTCGAALDWPDGALGLCRACWDATERDEEAFRSCVEAGCRPGQHRCGVSDPPPPTDPDCIEAGCSRYQHRCWSPT